MDEDLFQQLGHGYSNEMLMGAPFLYKGEAYLLGEVTEGKTISAFRLVGDDPASVVAKATKLPAEFFTGWKSFAFPTLGYRSVRNGQVLAYLSRNNSVRRGLNPRDIRVEYHDVSHTCSAAYGFNLGSYNQNNAKAALVMKPQYTGFNEGIARILQGEIPSFALSADFAVAPHEDVPYLEILFRQRRVGLIDETGKVNIDGVHILTSWNNVVSGELSNEQD